MPISKTKKTIAGRVRRSGPSRKQASAARARSGQAPVVLITGASQGIGATIARAFAEGVPGVRLALVARDRRKLQDVAASCRRLGRRAKAEVFVADVTSEASVSALKAAVESTWGTVEVLVNNAGRFRPGAFLEMSPAEFDEMLSANLRSVFLVSRAFVPRMVARGKGDVFNMSSIAGLQGYPGGAGYCAAKFGVTGLSKVMRTELKAKGIRVCTVYPGATVSPSWEGSGVAEERLMPADDVARAFLQIFHMTRRTVVEEIVLRPQLGDL